MKPRTVNITTSLPFGQLLNGQRECRDHSISRIDLWVSAFAGLASSGMNWGKMYKNSLWQDYSKILYFAENILFQGQGIHTNHDWGVGWAGGDQLFTNNTYTIDSSLFKIEAIYLYDKIKKNKGFGILINKMWNPLTGPRKLPTFMNQTTYESFYTGLQWIPEFNIVEYDPNNKIKLYGFKHGSTFRITYYNINSLSIQQIEYDNTRPFFGSKVALKNFPSLTWDSPFCLFSIDYDSNAFGMVTNPNNINNYEEDSIKDNNILDDENENNINSNSENKVLAHITIYDSIGREIESNKTSTFNEEILTRLTNGIYLFVYTYTDGTLNKKKIHVSH